MLMSVAGLGVDRMRRSSGCSGRMADDGAVLPLLPLLPRFLHERICHVLTGCVRTNGCIRRSDSRPRPFCGWCRIGQNLRTSCSTIQGCNGEAGLHDIKIVARRARSGKRHTYSFHVNVSNGMDSAVNAMSCTVKTDTDSCAYALQCKHGTCVD